MFARLAELAAVQFGVVAREQLLALGVSATTISRWVNEGRLVRLYRGVYAVGHANLSVNGRRMAAVLACGSGAVLSHLTAAAHWGLLRSSAAAIHISLPSHRTVRAQGRIRIHQTRLHPSDTAIHESIPVTSPMRTLLDLAGVVSEARLREAIEQSERLQLFDRHELDSLIARNKRRKGLKALRRLLAELGDHPPDLRSAKEQDLLNLIRAAGLPIPVTNVYVEDILVDAYWPKHDLVVELDSYGFHRSKAKFEEDRLNTEILQNAGHTVRRFSTDRLDQAPPGVIATLRAELG